VIDLFAGTGTTGVAALQLRRRLTGMDLSAAFIGVPAERLRHAVA
jgi:DNA modification methylase